MVASSPNAYLAQVSPDRHPRMHTTLDRNLQNGLILIQQSKCQIVAAPRVKWVQSLPSHTTCMIDERSSRGARKHLPNLQRRTRTPLGFSTLSFGGDFSLLTFTLVPTLAVTHMCIFHGLEVIHSLISRRYAKALSTLNLQSKPSYQGIDYQMNMRGVSGYTTRIWTPEPVSKTEHCYDSKNF